MLFNKISVKSGEKIKMVITKNYLRDNVHCMPNNFFKKPYLEANAYAIKECVKIWSYYSPTILKQKAATTTPLTQSTLRGEKIKKIRAQIALITRKIKKISPPPSSFSISLCVLLHNK